ncbi:hypothetical protein HAX54_014201 [Datura stramonium]|uniref:Uncharacterized protein n=1 Tax=Datura stramonium TaxID=4076 RepID=A0ABS8RYW3_DATST|nr:hypothetical protein [Datura stramonium]
MERLLIKNVAQCMNVTYTKESFLWSYLLVVEPMARHNMVAASDSKFPKWQANQKQAHRRTSCSRSGTSRAEEEFQANETETEFFGIEFQTFHDENGIPQDVRDVKYTTTS